MGVMGMGWEVGERREGDEKKRKRREEKRRGEDAEEVKVVSSTRVAEYPGLANTVAVCN